MAKAKEKTKEKEKKQRQEVGFKFPLTRTNFMIILLGVVILIIGYIFMAIPDDPNAFFSRTLAPIILVIG